MPVSTLPRFPALLAAVLVLLVSLGAVPAHAADDGMAVADRVMRALDLIGTPYRKRGETPEAGFDCSGFMGYVFRMANRVSLPRTAREMFALASTRAQKVARDAIAPGDLVFFRIGRLGKRIDHVGLYIGDNRFVHAPASGGAVRIDTLDLPYWQKTYAGARRISVPLEGASPAPAEDTAMPAPVETGPLAAWSPATLGETTP